MPMCTYPAQLGGCTQYAVKNKDRCERHQIFNITQQKLEDAAVSKSKSDAAAKKHIEDEREKRDAEANAIRDRKARIDALQAEVIAKHVQTWSAQIRTVFDQVEALRAQNADANAGQNNVGNTEGGSKNPIQLSLSGPTHGVTHKQIHTQIPGFDGSDSGGLKYRRKTNTGSDILIHIK